ncbi:proline/glycine betaine ABC transporter ATP-binding protein [Streptomyces sp. Tue6028]|uniref:ABC transporter ATP-binding protein n=1 Tax=Streptomyces sp. Tue6028 TaxID=2036037 RepID=UPI000BB3AE30|nr:ATP-binding cassette domain-containing protein [Streptomyces sp. Tue6028]PBC60098.1 proline/glycine betaine ABC transporter ATP-binding protein [Streptomyces sp. Tue6028]
MIAIEDVSKRYADGTVAVDRLSLQIPDHSITVLVGPSGCGKTTTLRMINRMVEPSSGTIRINGEDIRSRPVNALRRSMGYVIQNAGLFQHRTILDNIATVPRLLGWSKERARARAAELMERVGLDPGMARRYPYQLSGGQQQRVGVARALASDPPILLMDEPFSAVDPVVRRGLQEELLRIQEELGKAIVFVTHDMDEAITVGDRVAVMRTGGKLAQFASPDELLSSPADAFVEEFLGADRGIRGLSFLSTRELTLDRTAVFPVGADWQEIAGRADAPAQVLVTDAAGRPLGWADPTAWGGEVEALEPHGQTFEVGRDSLRVALDRAVLSPTGRAVAVDGAGQVLGVAGQETIAAAIRAARRQRAADSEPGPSQVKAAR